MSNDAQVKLGCGTSIGLLVCAGALFVWMSNRVYTLGNDWPLLVGSAVAAALLTIGTDRQRPARIANDEMYVALAVWHQWAQDTEGCLRAASHGQRLMGIGNHDADFACCASVDSLQIVPFQAEPGVLKAS